MNLVVFELFPCLLRAKQNKIKGCDPDGVVQMFHLFCPRLYVVFQRDKAKGASN